MSGSDSPTFFHGQPWSTWIERIGRDKPLSDEETEVDPPSSVTRLSADDIDLYGFCPERDTFYGVVCEICNAIVKPQALIQHIESRHSGSVNLPPPSTPVSKAPIKTPYCKVSKLTKKTLGSQASSTSNNTSGISSGTSSTPASTNSSKINHSSIKRSTEQANLQSFLSNSSPRSPHDSINQISGSSSTSTTNTGIVPSSPIKSPGTNGNANGNQGSSGTTGTTSSGQPRRKRLKGDRGLLKDREYDPDRHCGVWNEETGKPCTRSLTCKAHTVSLRRTVVGRSKGFDKLLAEHRASKELPNRTPKGTVTGTVTVSVASTALKIPGTIGNDNETPSSPPVLSLPDTYPLPKTKLEEDFVKEEMRLESTLSSAGISTSSGSSKSMMAPISIDLPLLSPMGKSEVSQVATLIPATISPVIPAPLSSAHGQLPVTVLEGETASDVDTETLTLASIYSPVSLFKDSKSQLIMQIPRSNSLLQSSSSRGFQAHASMPSLVFEDQMDNPKTKLVNGKRINNHSLLLSPLGRPSKRSKHEFSLDFSGAIQVETTTNSPTSYPHFGDIAWSNCHPEPLAVSRWLRITSTRKQYNFNIH